MAEAPGASPRAIVRREVLRFAIPAAIGMVVLVLASLAAAVAVAREQSFSDARTTAEVLARSVVEPRIDDGLQVGKPARMAELDAAFAASISGSDVKSIRLWNEQGVVLYSNDPRLIGEQFPLPSRVAGEALQGMADTSRPENRYLDPQADWVQVSLPLTGGDGSRYLFEISKQQDSLRQEARGVWMAFAPILAGSMALLGLLLVILGIRMAQRISAELRTREELLQRAVDASELERSRIAADLHDGTVQQLAGLSFALAGLSQRARAAGDTETADVLSQAATTSRTSVRELRSLLVDIYPPNLEGSGLAPAIADLLAGLAGIEIDADLAELPDLDPPIREALYRVARELIANVAKHSRASHLRVRLAQQDTVVVLSVADDGRGFEPNAQREGHLGLRLVEDQVASIGGRLTILTQPGATSVTVEVPT